MNQQPLNIKPKPANDRGFLKGEFRDLYNKLCSIQESSLADDCAIWLGADEATHYFGHDVIDLEKMGFDCAARMHLNQEQAAELIKVLQYFVDKGSLPEGGLPNAK